MNLHHTRHFLLNINLPHHSDTSLGKAVQWWRCFVNKVTLTERYWECISQVPFVSFTSRQYCCSLQIIIVNLNVWKLKFQHVAPMRAASVNTALLTNAAAAGNIYTAALLSAWGREIWGNMASLASVSNMLLRDLQTAGFMCSAEGLLLEYQYYISERFQSEYLYQFDDWFLCSKLTHTSGFVPMYCRTSVPPGPLGWWFFFLNSMS